MSDWPTLGEELSRKALSVIETALYRAEQGEITDGDAFNLVDAIYDVCSGLVPEEALQQILEVRKALQISIEVA